MSSIDVAAWGQNGTPDVGIQISTDGVNFTSVYVGTTGSVAASLSGYANLQKLSGTATVRVYLFGIGAGQSSGLGRADGDDIALVGTAN